MLNSRAVWPDWPQTRCDRPCDALLLGSRFSVQPRWSESLAVGLWVPAASSLSLHSAISSSFLQTQVRSGHWRPHQDTDGDLGESLTRFLGILQESLNWDLMFFNCPLYELPCSGRALEAFFCRGTLLPHTFLLLLRFTSNSRACLYDGGSLDLGPLFSQRSPAQRGSANGEEPRHSLIGNLVQQDQGLQVLQPPGLLGAIREKNGWWHSCHQRPGNLSVQTLYLLSPPCTIRWLWVIF